MSEGRARIFSKFDVVCAIVCIVVVVGVSGVVDTSSRLRNRDTALPFDELTQQVLKASDKKVFAVYTPVFPLSFDNLDSGVDYYTEQYLNLNGENSNYAPEGALLRERPLPRAIDPSPDWQLNDMRTEVERASNAGLDGFIYDLLTTDGVLWDRLHLLLEAAKLADPKFKIMLMPDVGAGHPSTEDVDRLTAKIASIANDAALFRLPDGRLVVSPFAPEIQGVNWWQNFITILESVYRIPVAFVPTFLDYKANATAFAPLSFGMSNWGPRSSAGGNPGMRASELGGFRDDAHNKGKIWMQPVAVQDNRPSAGIYWEANNTDNLRDTWSAAIEGADWVQIATWNDYTENTQISPSTHIGWSPLDINSYYLTQFKQGFAPSIVRDVLYVSHRVQPFGLIPTNQTKVMTLGPFSAPARDAFEILSFLKEPATITVAVGDNHYSYDAPAGVSARTFPLAFGHINAQARVGDRVIAHVVSKFPVGSRRATQDLQYYFTSSSRDHPEPPAHVP
ncbi:glycoside hydrolase family 71 protein [Mycobacterium sp. SMC-13]|uniref:glycoside hydrolase family 71 protein n=1 Tax=Mycobacterium sp. SMC-13 TaxID=3381626 RepID=UPI003875E043